MHLQRICFFVCFTVFFFLFVHTTGPLDCWGSLKLKESPTMLNTIILTINDVIVYIISRLEHQRTNSVAMRLELCCQPGYLCILPWKVFAGPLAGSLLKELAYGAQQISLWSMQCYLCSTINNNLSYSTLRVSAYQG